MGFLRLKQWKDIETFWSLDRDWMHCNDCVMIVIYHKNVLIYHYSIIAFLRLLKVIMMLSKPGHFKRRLRWY